MNSNIFNSVRVESPKSSTFDMSFSNRLSMPIGKLIPVLAEECLPGDYWTLRSESLVRFAPLVSPVMEKFDVYIDYFFVPYRLLWEQFEGWIMGTANDTSVPQMFNTDGTTNQYEIGGLADYFGIPVDLANDYTVGLNMMMFVAYQKIWFDWYRDNNLELQDEDWDKTYKIDDDNFRAKYNKTGFYFTLRNANWEHDYFTSALPWAQRGDAITIPFTLGDAPVKRDIKTIPDNYWFVSPNNANSGSGIVGDSTGDPGRGNAQIKDTSGNYYDTHIEIKQHYADLDSSVFAPTIEEFRRAVAIQKWLELTARTGSRYNEYVEGNYDMKTQDYRLGRAEFIASERYPVIVSEVLQTSETTDTNVLGQMAGRAISSNAEEGKNYLVREHGCIIGLCYVKTRAAYFQGVDRKFLRKDKFDYGIPSLAQIGEQPIYNLELIVQNNTDDYETFGYQSRYADWKYSKNMICGEFKTTLDEWHYARKFANVPSLNPSFVQWSNDQRIFAVADQQNVLMWLNFKNFVSRKLPFYGTPTL